MLGPCLAAAGAEPWCGQAYWGEPTGRRRIADLSERKEKLEGQLARESAGFREATQPATLDDVRAALPQDAVLVDFLEYRHMTPESEGQAGQFEFERRLVAFVVSKNGVVLMMPAAATRS